MSIRVLIVDDHTILRQGIKRILESAKDIVVVGEAGSGIQAVQMADKFQPDVTVMDIGMPDLNGIDAAAQTIRCSPKTAVLILSMYSDERYVIRAVRAGAKGYLVKDSVEEDLIRAIRALDDGQSYFSPAISTILLEGYNRELKDKCVDDRYELLTARERTVYQMLAEGNSNKDIAKQLNLSLHTVETHRLRIMDKMDVHSIAELVLSAVRRGLVS